MSDIKLACFHLIPVSCTMCLFSSTISKRGLGSLHHMIIVVFCVHGLFCMSCQCCVSCSELHWYDNVVVTLWRWAEWKLKKMCKHRAPNGADKECFTWPYTSGLVGLFQSVKKLAFVCLLQISLLKGWVAVTWELRVRDWLHTGWNASALHWGGFGSRHTFFRCQSAEPRVRQDQSSFHRPWHRRL